MESRVPVIAIKSLVVTMVSLNIDRSFYLISKQIMLATFIGVSSLPASDQKSQVPIEIDFEELATSLDQTFLEAVNKGSSPAQLELDATIEDESLPRIVPGVEGQGAAIQFQGRDGAVAVLRDVEWTQGAWQLSFSFKAAEGQPLWSHILQVTNGDGQKIASAIFNREEGSLEDDLATKLAMDGPAAGSRHSTQVGVTNDQWHQVVLHYDPQGGRFNCGTFATTFDGEEMGPFDLRELAVAPSSVTIAFGAQHSKYRSFKDAIDKIRLEFLD